MSPANEIALIHSSQAGDQQAFGQIVESYQSLICGIAYSATGDIASSEDLAQETFVAAWQQLKQLSHPEKFRAWLCGIARNLINSHFRRRGRDKTQGGGSAEELALSAAGADATAEQEAIRREEESLLWSILGDIPETYREPMVLFYREQQSVDRVAELLALSPDAVKQRLSRGRRMLRETVAGFVHSALEKTRPGKAFVAGVLALLPAVSAEAMSLGVAATTATATTVAKGAAAVKGAGAVKAAAASSPFWGVILGPLLGVLGAIFGARASLADARSKREKKFLWKVIGLVNLLVAALLVSVFLVRVVWPEVFASAAYQGISWGIYSVLLVLLINAANRRQRAIREEDGTLTSQEQRFEPMPVSRGAMRGSLMGAMFGGTCWIWISALLAQDWATLVVVVCGTVGLWYKLSFPWLGDNSAERQMAVHRWAVLSMGGIGMAAVTLRWSAWQALAWHPANQAPGWLVNLMLLAMTGGILLILRSRERSLREQKSVTEP